MRPDNAMTSPRTLTTDILFNISTTTKEPENLSMRFADNLGDDQTVVIDGPISLSTENVGPPDGPRVFDVAIKLDKPFYYDPSQGNLLIDWTFPPVRRGRYFSISQSVPPGGCCLQRGCRLVVSYEPVARLPVWQAVFVPEPSSTLLCLLACSVYLVLDDLNQ